jgi:Arc/MetJ-type ribon-helix-helix transcriptional regulator
MENPNTDQAEGRNFHRVHVYLDGHTLALSDRHVEQDAEKNRSSYIRKLVRDEEKRRARSERRV